MGLGTRLFGMGLFLTPICKLMFGATTLRTNPQLVSDCRGRFARLDLPKVLAILPLLTGRDSLHSRLGEIDIPALVIVGAEDRSLPVKRDPSK